MISVSTYVIFSIFQGNLDLWTKVGIGLGGFLFGILLMTIIHTCKKKKEKKQYVYNIFSKFYLWTQLLFSLSLHKTGNILY